MTDKQSTNPWGFPDFDFAEMARQFQVPGVDFSQLMEEGRKNIEAVQQANQAIADGWQEIAEKQAEVFRESMEQMQQAFGEGSGSAAADLEGQAQVARERFEQALDNMRQMAEIAAESQSKAIEVIRARIEENISAVTGAATKSADDAGDS
jgi:phasin family protein